MSISMREAQDNLNALEITVPLSAHDPIGRPWQIIQPWDKLLAKYFTPGNHLSIEFDLYAARRAASDPGWRNRLEGADLMATGLMNSRIASADVDAVLERRAEIETPSATSRPKSTLRMSIPGQIHFAAT